VSRAERAKFSEWREGEQKRRRSPRIRKDEEEEEFPRIRKGEEEEEEFPRIRKDEEEEEEEEFPRIRKDEEEEEELPGIRAGMEALVTSRPPQMRSLTSSFLRLYLRSGISVLPIPGGKPLSG